MNSEFPLILEDYLNYLKTVRGLSPRTVQEYAYDLRAFLRFLRWRRGGAEFRSLPLEEIPINDMTEKDLENVRLNDLHAFLAHSEDDRGNSSNRRARLTSSIRSFYKYLVVVEEYFEKNPADRLSAPKRKKRHPVYLTLEEAFHLIETTAHQDNIFFRYRDVAMIVTFLTTGIRLSELCGMNVGSLRDTYFNVIGKGNKERTVYMTESCQQSIQAYLNVRPKVPGENALFLSTRNRRISPRAVQHRIEHFLREAGFDTEVYSTHKLRHTAATLMYKEGVDIRTLQRILGHASLQTTQIYTHVEDQMAREAVEKNPLSRLPIEKLESQ